MANISGITRINGVIESCTVRLYSRSTGALISEVESDEVTGEYSFPTLNPRVEYDLVCIGTIEVCPQISGPLAPIVNTDYYDAVVLSGPTAYWRMDDTDSTLTDDNGLYDGTYSGTPLYEQSPLLNEGVSVQFDGSTDSALVPDSAALRPGTGEYCIEMWMSFTSSGTGMAFGKFALSVPYRGATVFCNYFNDSNQAGRIELRDERTAGYWVDTIQGNLNDGVPRHYVFQRRLVDTLPDVWALEIYIDGVLDNSVILPSALDLSTAEDMFVASRPTQEVAGTFDEIAYYVGSALTPSEVSDHYSAGLLPGAGIYDNLVLLDLKFNEPVSSTTFIDDSIKANTINEFGNAVSSDAQSYSGGTSLLLDGSGDYLSIPHDDGKFTILGNFTVECWIYRTSPDSVTAIVTKYGGPSSGFFIEIGSAGKVFAGFGSGSYESTTLDQVIPVDEWVHIAICKDGSTLRGYINGIKLSDYSITGTLADHTGTLNIGRDQLDPSRDFQGHIQNFKWTHGVALYTDDFTPV